MIAKYKGMEVELELEAEDGQYRLASGYFTDEGGRSLTRCELDELEIGLGDKLADAWRDRGADEAFELAGDR